MDKFVDKDGKEVLSVTDDNKLFIDKALKELKKKKVIKDAASKSEILPEDGEDNSN